MKLVLKVNDEGVPEVIEENGVKKPVFVDEDTGRDMPMDVPSLYSNVAQLKGENKDLKTKYQGAQQTLGLFEGVENLEEWKRTADEAIEKVGNWKDSDYVKANKVEELKANMKTAHETELRTVKTSFEGQVGELTESVKKKDDQIRALLIGNKFASSPLFVGEKRKTTLNPAVAESYFGKHFEVVERQDGQLDVIGRNSDGSEIYSILRPGEIADFNEALEIIIDRDPGKNDYLKSSQGAGSGAGGGSGQGGGTPTDELKALEAEYEEARKAGNGRLAIQLKNKMHAVRMKVQNNAA
jgi:hypothetical protein